MLRSLPKSNKHSWLSSPFVVGVRASWGTCCGSSFPFLPQIPRVSIRGISQNYIFLESWRTRLWKHLPGPINNELIFLEFSMFPSAVVPKISSSLEYQKELSAQSQLRFIPKLHNEGFTCRAFYQIMKPPLLCRLCPVCAGRCYMVIHPGKLWDTSNVTASLSYEETLCQVSFQYLYKWPSYAHWGEQMSWTLAT